MGSLAHDLTETGSEHDEEASEDHCDYYRGHPAGQGSWPGPVQGMLQVTPKKRTAPGRSRSAEYMLRRVGPRVLAPGSVRVPHNDDAAEEFVLAQTADSGCYRITARAREEYFSGNTDGVNAAGHAPQEVCAKYGAPFVETPPDAILAVADNIRTGIWSLNGFRHGIGQTSGWFLFGGTE